MTLRMAALLVALAQGVNVLVNLAMAATRFEVYSSNPGFLLSFGMGIVAQSAAIVFFGLYYAAHGEAAALTPPGRAG
ncbi:MAG TPA: hypothetical protein VMS22_02980 [Candidatus Eisenbacteria bacterium]|nr:hypothetical protein [Candidatus Eisenbacteria bacterium]